MKHLNLFAGIISATGFLLLATVAHAQGASFNDSPLSPGSNPSGASGTDLLLAENVAGPRVIPPYAPWAAAPAPAESWTTQLQYEVTSDTTASGQMDSSKSKTIQTSFSGSGPTGTYASGTINSGSATLNTKALIVADSIHNQKTGYAYIYIFKYTYFEGLQATRRTVLRQSSFVFTF